jgi:sugar lactone lactonase YvrE
LSGSGVYYACPPGTYNPYYASSTCTIIPVGYYGPFSAATAVYQSCSYAVNEGAINCIDDSEFIVPILASTLVSPTAGLNSPTDVALSSTGALYVTDSSNHVIRRVSSTTGTMTVFAGRSGVANWLDGTGTSSQFDNPTGITIDSFGVLYVVDAGNSCIRKILSSALVSTLAGSPGNPGYADGSGTDALFSSPVGIAVDTSLHLYVTDNLAVIRYITPSGSVTTIAGSPSLITSYGDGIGTDAFFNNPSGITIDPNGYVYVVDAAEARIRRIDSAMEVRTVAGDGTQGNADGAGTHARLNYPYGAVSDSSGNVYITSTGYGLVRKIETNGVVTTLVGYSVSAGSPDVDGVGTSVVINGPHGLTVDTSTGNLFVVGTSENTVRQLSLYNSTCVTGSFFNDIFCAVTPAGYYLPLTIDATDVESMDVETDAYVDPAVSIAAVSDSDNNIMYACPAGYYSRYTSSSSCVASPSGNFTPVAGLPFFYACPNNTYGLGAGSECVPESVYPTSFPTFSVPVKRISKRDWLYIIIGLVCGLVLCCLMCVVCYFKCWRDTEEEHAEHAKRHDIQFGVEGDTTIQTHAVSDYISIKQQQLEAVPQNVSATGMPRQSSNQSMNSRSSHSSLNMDSGSAPTLANYDHSRGKRRDHYQVVTVAIDREHRHRSHAPPPTAQSVGIGMVDRFHTPPPPLPHVSSPGSGSPHMTSLRAPSPPVVSVEYDVNARLPPRPSTNPYPPLHRGQSDAYMVDAGANSPSSMTYAVPLSAPMTSPNMEMSMRRTGSGTYLGQSSQYNTAAQEVRPGAPPANPRRVGSSNDVLLGGVAAGVDSSNSGYMYQPSPSRNRSPAVPEQSRPAEFDQSQAFYVRSPSEQNSSGYNQAFKGPSPPLAEDYYQQRARTGSGAPRSSPAGSRSASPSFGANPYVGTSPVPTRPVPQLPPRIPHSPSASAGFTFNLNEHAIASLELPSTSRTPSASGNSVDHPL